MKKTAQFSILVGFVMVLTACGSPATATSAVNQPPATTEAPVGAATATEAAIEAPVAAPAVASSDAETVVVTLDDNTISSSETTFNVGVPYRFVVTNEGRHEHKFSISQPVSVAGSLGAAESGALIAIGTNQLGPGDSVTVEFTFPASAAGGPLEFACLIRRHYEDGMLQAITVLP
jgi:uncharacterized cupredoxin-like copper-binding protein